MNENHIRDKIITQLELIEPNIEYLDKEYYLPIELGTTGFIDILCKDRLNKLVVIEVKKTKHATRETFNEILKYYQSIKSYKCLRDDEIRVVIISINWDELLTPFLVFKNYKKINIKGLKLYITENGDPVKFDQIEELELYKGRIFSINHIIRKYKNKSKLELGLKEHIKIYDKKFENGYVLLSLEAPESHYDEVMKYYKNIAKELGFDNPPSDYYPYIIYFAPLLMTEIEYLNKMDSEQIDNCKSQIGYYRDTDPLEVMSDFYSDIPPYPSTEETDISYPAKLKKILNEEKWSITSYYIGGKLKENNIFTYDDLLLELKGSTGINKSYFEKTFYLDEYFAIQEDLDIILKDNNQWRIEIKEIINDIKKEKDNLHIEINLMVFNPMNILSSLYNYISKSDTNYLPQYFIKFNHLDTNYFYYGTLTTTSNVVNQEIIIKKYFGEDLKIYSEFSSVGYDMNDNLKLKDYELKYFSCLTKTNGYNVECFRFQDYRFERETVNLDPFSGLKKYVEMNNDFIKEIISIGNKIYIQ